MLVKKLFAIFLLGSIFSTFYLASYLHHKIVFGLNPFLGWIFLVVAAALLIPSIVFVSKRIGNFLKPGIRFTPDTLFAIGILNIIFSGLLQQFLYHSISFDFQFHNTYYVFSLLLCSLWVGIVFVIYSASYYYFPSLYTKRINRWLAYSHFWITITGVFFFFSQFPLYEGLAGMPRRYIDYGGYGGRLYALDEIFRFRDNSTIVLIYSQLLFVLNIFVSTFLARTSKT